MESLCKYIEANDLHFLIVKLMEENKLGYFCLVAIVSLLLTYLAYKIKQRIDSLLCEAVNTTMSILGYEPSITVLILSLLVTVVLCYKGLPLIINECHLIESGNNLKNILDKLIIYISLFFCVLLLINAFVSFLSAIIGWCKDKSSKFALVDLSVAVIQFGMFFYSIPDYKNNLGL